MATRQNVITITFPLRDMVLTFLSSITYQFLYKEIQKKMPNYVLIKSYFVISHLNPRTFKLLLRNDRGFDISSLRPVIWQQRAPDRKAEARNLHNLLCYAWFPHVHVEMTCLWPSRVYCIKFWITTSPAIVIGPWAHWSLLKYFSQSGVVFVWRVCWDRRQYLTA